MEPNDKPQKTSLPDDRQYEDPKLFIVVDEEVFPRPGLETAFVDLSEMSTTSEEFNTGYSSTKSSGIHVDSVKITTICTCDLVRTVICTCNKMISCSCFHHTCSCVGHVKTNNRSTGTTRGGIGCSCAPVH